MRLSFRRGPDVAPDGARSVNLLDATSFPRLSAVGYNVARSRASTFQTAPPVFSKRCGAAEPQGEG
jgi:hypothetical protein